MHLVENERWIIDRNQRLSESTTFEDLLSIALEEIDRLVSPVGIICGPLTSGGHGSLEKNMKEFQTKIEELIGVGLKVFNQMPYESHMQRIKATPYYDPTRNHLLEVFYGNLFRSGKINTWYFIQGWDGSYGARWEHELVQSLNGQIIYPT